MIIDQSYAGQQIELAVGTVAELRLPENPTTGYRWVVTSAASPACNLVDGSFRTRSGPPGRGGQHVWQLRALAPGACDLQLTYRRSFAPDAAGNSSFVLHVQITEPPKKG